MTEIPAIVRILKRLRQNTAPLTYEDVINFTPGGQVYVEEALEQLVSEGIINRRGDYLSYSATAEAEDFCQKLFALYDKVTRREEMELIIRGLLCHPALGFLLEKEGLLSLMEKEGFVRELANQFIEDEVGRGYIKMIRLGLVAKPSFVPPLFFPISCISCLRRIEIGIVQEPPEQGGEQNSLFREIDYLAGNYPSEVARPAIRQVELYDYIFDDLFEARVSR